MKIFDIELDNLKYNDFMNNIKSDLNTDKNEQKIIFTPNPEILLKTLEDREFKDLLEKANFLTIDGIWIYIWAQILENKKNPLAPFSGGIIWNILLLPYYFFNLFFRKKYLYKKYWERICGSDLTSDLVSFSEKENIKITILDPYYPQDLKKVEAQKNFRKNLLKKFPKLNFDFFIYKKEEKEDIIKKICSSNSKILFSTLWMKSQEKSIIEIMEKSPNLKLWLWIGSSFDYFIWFQKRAPKLFRNLWIEWLYRIFTWPQKLKRLKRLYNAIFVFIWKVLVYKKK